jgi:hypothetical protein
MQNLHRGFDLDQFDPLSADPRSSLIERIRGGSGQELLQQTVLQVDRHSRHWGDWCSQEDLLRPSAIAGDRGGYLRKEDILELISRGVLVPQDIFLPDRGLRLEPLMDLLRSRVNERLQ